MYQHTEASLVPLSNHDLSSTPGEPLSRLLTSWITLPLFVLYANCISNRNFFFFFLSGLFPSILYLWVAIFCSFSLLYSIALCEYTIIYLSIQLLITLWVVSRLALWILLLWIFMDMSFGEHMHAFFQMLKRPYIPGINHTFRDILSYLYVAGSRIGIKITAFMWLKEISL